MPKIQPFTNEQDVEEEAIDLIVSLGYTDLRSAEYNRPNIQVDSERDNDHQKIVLEPRLMAAFKQINPGLPNFVYTEALRQFKSIPDGPDLMANNHHFHKLLIEGASVTENKNGQPHTYSVKAVDFNNIAVNDFMVTNPFTMKQGGHNRRPDITIFINGLPVVTFELKNQANENVGIEDAYNQLQTYKQDISDYMAYNEVLIASDGVNARTGSLSAGFDRFMQWRSPDHRDFDLPDSYELETMITNMLKPAVILDLIQNFIIFESNDAKTSKILAAYHQYYMVNKAVDRTAETLQEPQNNRIGVVWHTQGSGKSLSMVFFSGIVSRKLRNPTILVINDRNDLDDQLEQTFSAAHDYLRQTPKQAKSRTDTRDLLATNSGGIIFSTIQKFSPEDGEDAMPVLTSRSNVIVISDEAHRSQYGMKARYTKDGVRYGFAQYLRDSLPNASFIGFTGTPINIDDKSTTGVFGDYIDVYDMTQSVRDHTTVRIFYENHVIPLDADPEVQHKYEALIDEAGQDNPGITDDQKRKADFTSLERLAGATSRLKALAKHFVHHFEAHQAVQFGKAIIVETSRRNAVKLFNEIVKLRPLWYSDDLTKGKIKIVMTSDTASDGPELAKHHTNAKQRRALQQRMKDDNDELQIVIVVNMWLTGFDAPSVNTMYVDKPMHGHNLMQAIARVNRVFRDKDGGLIVDYIGIADSLNQALRHYSKNDRDQAGINVDKAVSLMKSKYDIIINDYLYGVNYSGYNSDIRGKRQESYRLALDAVVSLDKEQQKKFADTVVQLQKVYALVVTSKQAQAISSEVAFFGAVKSALMKILQAVSPHDNPVTNRELNLRLDQLVNQSVIAKQPVDLYKELGLERPELSLLSEKFLDSIQNMPEQNLAVKLLERLLKGKVKALTKVNLIQSRRFGDMLENNIEALNQRGVTTEIVIRKLIELAKNMQETEAAGESLGLSANEQAFYDALCDQKTAVQVMGEDTLQEIAKELVGTVRKYAATPDWVQRKTTQAAMRQAVRRMLKDHGYPPTFAPVAVDTIVEQAQTMAFENNY